MERIKGLAEKYHLNDWNRVIPLAWLLFGWLWNIWFQLVKGQKLLDSDMAAELVLSDILNTEHSISGLTTSWRYSSELRALNMQWFYRIGLALFPTNWHFARSISMAMAILLLAFSVWLVFHAAGLSDLGIWAAAFTLFPGGAWYFWLGTFGGYYLPYIYISLFTFALLILGLKDIRSVRSKIYLLIVVLLGLGSGLNGIKQLMVFYAPLIIMSCCMLIVEYRDKASKNRKNAVGFAIGSFAASLSSFIGYLINSKILSQIYMFKEFDETKIKSKSFMQLVKEYIWSFGYAEDKVLMSPEGIASMCGVVFGLIVIISGILMMLRFKSLSYELKQLTSFSVISIVFCIFIFSYVKQGNIEYYQPIVPMGYFLVLLEIYTAEFTYKKSRSVMYNLAIVLLLITSLGTVYNEEHEPYHSYRAHPGLNEIVTWLKGGYSDGVSAFWTSNICTELSDGRIDMWTLEDDSLEWHNWLQREDHFGNFPKGRYFYLVDNKEIDEEENDEYYINLEIMNAFLAEHPELTLIHQDENYTIYGTLE